MSVEESEAVGEVDEGCNAESEAYYRLLDDQMSNLLKETERKLESVRKERNSAINSIEHIVKQTYQGQNS